MTIFDASHRKGIIKHSSMHKPSQMLMLEKPGSTKKPLFSLLPVPTRSTTVGCVLVCGPTGQRGLGPDFFEKSRPFLVPGLDNIVDVDACGSHTLVLTEDGKIYSFGHNDEDALGRDTSEYGSKGSPGLVALPGEAVMISAGCSHSACLLKDGTVVAWGSFLDSRGNVVMTVNDNARSPTRLLPNKKCVKIASGNDHLAILTEDGKLFTMGCGEYGQLGRVTTSTVTGEGCTGEVNILEPQEVVVSSSKSFVDLYTSRYCTYVKEKDTNKIWACGLNDFNQLVIEEAIKVSTVIRVTKFPNVKIITGGQHHTVALDHDGVVWVVGRHSYGILGLGAIEEDVRVLTKLDAFNSEQVRDICCGEFDSFAITSSGKLYGWGSNLIYMSDTENYENSLVPIHLVPSNMPEKSALKVSCGVNHKVFLMKANNPNELVSEETKTQAGNKNDDSKTGEPEAKCN